MKITAPLVFLILLTGCVSPPKGVQPVSGFDLDRYLGTWHEIARLDHPFERGLNQVTAEYRLRDDGGVDVINRGYDTETGEWREARGKAYFVDDATTGHLKVSFFGPFYGGYIVVELDREGYSYSMVSGPNRDYLWILSRTPEMDESTLRDLIANARGLGYPVDDLIFVEQSP